MGVPKSLKEAVRRLEDIRGFTTGTPIDTDLHKKTVFYEGSLVGYLDKEGGFWRHQTEEVRRYLGAMEQMKNAYIIR